ncbi:hypothetical protein WJX74_002316 [Apatococcus lobatus]|uniref:WW domain-containing protein n=1 Tax=Apatococcus lobatus TaxID=904363 RepID=A0AAW1RKZ7_9CHLO
MLKLLQLLLVLCVCAALIRDSVGATPGSSDVKQAEYFWNEVTGESQWEDPGGVPYHDENGQPYWLTPDGKQSPADPEATSYTWIEGWSEEWARPYFFNQETRESKWDRPADMAWHRAPAKDEL